MIVKIKLGDLSYRQVVKICRAYNSCLACPLHKPDDPTICAFVITPCDFEDSLDREVEISTDIICSEMAESFETKFAELKAKVEGLWSKETVTENTLLYLARMLGYNFGGVNPKCLRMRIIKSDHTLPPDEPYQYKPKVCVEDEEE